MKKTMIYQIKKSGAVLLGWALSLVLLTMIPLAASAQSSCTLSDTPTDVSRWIESRFAKGKVPPFSFVYDGKPSAGLLRKWKYTAQRVESSEPGVREYLYSYQDRRSGLKVECRVKGFSDFGAVEWVLNFKNLSDANSATIEQVKVLDLDLTSPGEGSFTVHYADGSHVSKADFHQRTKVLAPGDSLYMAPEGGRSSDHTGFPFMNLEASNGRGAIVAVGWTGNWYVDVSQQMPGTATLASGMKNLNLYLLPGETIRTPLVCMLFWQGEDRMVGHNMFRRFMLAHHSPKLNGRFAEYPFSGGYSWGDPAPCNEYCCLTEDFALALTKRYAQFGIVPEVFWLDAGWYKGCGGPDFTGKNWYNTVGTLEVDEKRFPNGLKPLSEAAHEAGAKFMVWFEPERVAVGSQIAEEHPEWLLKRSNDPNNLLFDLGNPEALNWMCEHIGDLIEKNGIDYYRQDFNMHISPYWAEADEPDRVGIHEIRHVEGLYAYWDYLRERFPGLLIDNCAGGGRRLDLETMSRSAPLWRTDYSYGEVNGYQCHTYGLNFYLPIHGTGLYKTDPYSVRSALGSAAVLNWKLNVLEGSIADMQQIIAQYKELRPYYYEDYYPLTGTARELTSDNAWLAYQMHRPSDQSGIVVAFRRKDNQQDSIRVRLRGVDPAKTYRVLNDNDGTVATRSGAELAEGIDLKIAEAPGSLLLRYSEAGE